MDSFNWLVLELLTREAVRERLDAQPHMLPQQPIQRDGRGVKRTLASYLVRVGLRLDPAAGEGLRAPNLPLARPEAGQQA